jgi:hypothetical protein
MENNVYDLSELKTKWENIWSKFSDSENMRYLHMKSVDNFIYHLNSLPKKKLIKANAYNSVSNYLNLIREIDVSEMNRQHSEELFNTYLAPVGWNCTNTIGFIIYPRLYVIMIFYFVVLLALMLFEAGWIPHLIAFLFFVSMYIRREIKKKQKKVYGLFY